MNNINFHLLLVIISFFTKNKFFNNSFVSRTKPLSCFDSDAVQLKKHDDGSPS